MGSQVMRGERKNGVCYVQLRSASIIRHEIEATGMNQSVGDDLVARWANPRVVRVGQDPLSIPEEEAFEETKTAHRQSSISDLSQMSHSPYTGETEVKLPRTRRVYNQCCKPHPRSYLHTAGRLPSDVYGYHDDEYHGGKCCAP